MTSKSQGQGQNPKKLRNTFIPVYLMISGHCDSNFLVINALQYGPVHIIPEQFTVKAHPTSFEGESNKVALLFQSTFDIHIQNLENHTKKP